MIFMSALPGLIGFAQKLVLKTNNDTGKIGAAFLDRLNMFRLVLGAMMADASTETLGLIRDLDSERLDIGDISERISTYLHHLAWMFSRETLGVLAINGHCTCIIHWLERATVNFTYGKKVGSIGGDKVPMSVIVECLKHMEAWMMLAKQTCRAEFPDFELVCLLSAFRLPKGSDPTLAVQSLKSNEMQVKLGRLSHIFKKPSLPGQFQAMYHRAWLCYRSQNFAMSYWLAWRAAMSQSTRSNDDLLHVVMRGQIFVPVTSGVEQSFSRIDAIFTSRRQGQESYVENQSINLLMINYNEAALDKLVDKAVAIWRECCPKRHSRTHEQRRCDINIPNSSKGRSTDDGDRSERSFLKRVRCDIATQAARFGAQGSIQIDSLEGTARPSTWTPAQEDELKFQRETSQKASRFESPRLVRPV
jgi:hypothetical protein